MKKLLLIALLLILSSRAFAQDLALNMGTIGMAASSSPICSSSPWLDTSGAPDSDPPFAIGTSTNNTYQGQQFNDASAHHICRIDAYLSLKLGTIVGKTLTSKIWVDNSTNLGTQLGTSHTVPGSDSWSNTSVTFLFDSSISTSPSTTFVITLDQGVADASNYAVWKARTNILSGVSDGAYRNDGVRTNNAAPDVEIKIYDFQ